MFLFVYETLQHKKILADVLKRDNIEYQDSCIVGFKEVDAGDGYHTIILSRNDKVHGKIVQIDETELKALDDWEDKYRRVMLYDTDGIPVWAYILKEFTRN